MKLKKTQWNGRGYVQSTYEGRTALTNPYIKSLFIIEDFYRDPVGAVIQLKFEYKEDLDRFWDRINHEKSFKILPVEAKNPEGYRIQCRYYSRSPSKPIALAHVSEDTVVVWRVSIEEVIEHIPIKAILFNERFGDKFRIAKHEAYKKKLAQISLLEVLQNNLLDRQEELEEAQRELEKDIEESMSIAEEYGIEDIDDFMAWAKETYSKEAPQPPTEDIQTIQYDFDEISEDGEKRWVDVPGVGKWDRETGELVELPQPPTEE